MFSFKIFFICFEKFIAQILEYHPYRALM